MLGTLAIKTTERLYTLHETPNRNKLQRYFQKQYRISKPTLAAQSLRGEGYANTQPLASLPDGDAPP